MFGRMLRVCSSLSVESRARQIQDPIRRLRYLRQAHEVGPTPAYGSLPWRVAAVCALLALIGVQRDSNAHALHAGIPSGAPVTPDVWLVESTPDHEIYSNGLRVENRLAVSNRPRAFIPYDRRSPDLPPGRVSSDPVGIVYHTTESHCTPFQAELNQSIKRSGRLLLEFVRDNHTYNFVIDRYGGVYRIVKETDTAFHAGHSIWADAKWVYIGLNASFLGVAFEADTAQPAGVTAAQLHAGRVLTEMLRARYRIAAENCVTHAQVSVNPDKMLIGYHTDWSGNFPFREMGLNDNYAAPIPAVYLFGYGYDSLFLSSTGARLWKGLALAENRVLEEATLGGRTVAEYKKKLQKRYWEKWAVLERTENHESQQRETSYESE